MLSKQNIPLAPISRLLEETQKTLEELKAKVLDKTADQTIFFKAHKFYTDNDSPFNCFIYQINEFINNNEGSFTHLSVAKKMLERNNIKTYDIDLSSYDEINEVSNYPENILGMISSNLSSQLDIKINTEYAYNYYAYVDLTSQIKSRGFYIELIKYIIERCSVDIFLQDLRLQHLTIKEELNVNFGIVQSKKQKQSASEKRIILKKTYSKNIPSTFSLSDKKKYQGLLISLLLDLQKSGYVEQSVKLTTFKNCFTNCKFICEKIYWKGDKNELGYFIKLLIINSLINASKYKYETLKNCFQKRDENILTHNFRSDRKPKRSDGLDIIIKNFKSQTSAFLKI